MFITILKYRHFSLKSRKGLYIYIIYLQIIYLVVYLRNIQYIDVGYGLCHKFLSTIKHILYKFVHTENNTFDNVNTKTFALLTTKVAIRQLIKCVTRLQSTSIFI